MAAITPRVYQDNLAILTATVLTPSSEQPAFPVARVRDSRRSKTWRSLDGFVIQLGVNDVLDFNDGSDRAATITPGNYLTGAALATEVDTQMDAVSGTTFTDTYTGADKFSVVEDSGAVPVTLKWATGANAARSIGATLGFDTSADDVSGAPASFLSDNAVQKSVASVVVDLGSAQAVEAAVALETGVSGSGALKVQGNATSDFSSPSFETTLVAGDPRDTSKYLDFFAAETYRYWRFLWDDADDPDFSEAGVLFLGPKIEFERAYDLNLKEGRRVLSAITEADQGAIFTDVKPHPREWMFVFKDTSDADNAKWEDIEEAVRIGQHLFYATDPLNNPLTDTVYGFVRKPGIQFTRLRTFTDPSAAPVGAHTITFPFSEATG